MASPTTPLQEVTRGSAPQGAGPGRVNDAGTPIAAAPLLCRAAHVPYVRPSHIGGDGSTARITAATHGGAAPPVAPPRRPRRLHRLFWWASPRPEGGGGAPIVELAKAAPAPRRSQRSAAPTAAPGGWRARRVRDGQVAQQQGGGAASTRSDGAVPGASASAACMGQGVPGVDLRRGHAHFVRTAAWVMATAVATPAEGAVAVASDTVVHADGDGGGAAVLSGAPLPPPRRKSSLATQSPSTRLEEAAWEKVMAVPVSPRPAALTWRPPSSVSETSSYFSSSDADKVAPSTARTVGEYATDAAAASEVVVPAAAGPPPGGATPRGGASPTVVDDAGRLAPPTQDNEVVLVRSTTPDRLRSGAGDRRLSGATGV